MDEHAALALLDANVDRAGDDAAVVDDLAITTDMLHETTDFPPGTDRYTAGWRAVGASLSDVAAMGADAIATVAAYGAPSFEPEEIRAFVNGASDVCSLVGGEYVGGDLDGHEEFTVATTAIGRVSECGPIRRSGARVGDALCVTGSLGRTAAALSLFAVEGRESGEADPERANELFRFDPRVDAGCSLAPLATSGMDSSDGLARSLHQLAAASDCGFAVEGDRIPVAESLQSITSDHAEALDTAVTVGEDFELVVTLPAGAVDDVRETMEAPLARIGRVVDPEAGITLDGEALADDGFTHGV